MQIDIQKKLMKFAFETAYPYIIEQSIIKDHFDSISFILVGSTTTGLCTVDSDVDICLLCPQNIFDIIAINTKWINGRPTEVVIDGIQLHYYAISIESVIRNIEKMDDRTLYVYGTAVVINDSPKLFNNIQKLIVNPELIEKRKNSTFDMLTRRNRALKQVLLKERDPILRLRMCLELIDLLLAAIALTDNQQFDKRKKFYITALKGQCGMKLMNKIDSLLSLLGNVSNVGDMKTTNKFLEIFDYCIHSIK